MTRVMWRSSALVLVVLASMTVLVGCRLEADFPIYTRDLLDAVKDGKPIPISYDLLVPIPSSEKCAQYTTEIGEIIAPHFKKAEARGCFDKGMNSYLKLRVDTSIYPRPASFKQEEADKDQRAAKEPFAVYVSERNGVVCAGLTAEPNSLNAMLSAIKKKHSTAPTEFGFRFMFNNDLREPVAIIVRDVFIDGDPIIDDTLIKVARRDEKTIQPSNVREVALWRFGWGQVLCLKTE